MINGIEGVKPIVAPNKADRTDSWYKGKMTQRTVPSTSRRPAHRTLTAGSHLVSDIGEVPIPDHQGNRYFVVFKCMCTQFRKVYRMRINDALVRVWQQFIADYGMQEKEGKMFCRIKQCSSRSYRTTWTRASGGTGGSSRSPPTGGRADDLDQAVRRPDDPEFF